MKLGNEPSSFLKRGNKLHSIRMRRFTTRFAIRTESRLAQIDFRHDESTTGETIRVDSIASTRIDSIESTRIDNNFQPTLHGPPEVKTFLVQVFHTNQIGSTIDNQSNLLFLLQVHVT